MTRLMAAFMYNALYKQLTGKAKVQVTCAEEFECGATPFKHTVTGVKQKGGPGRQAMTSKRSVEEVTKAEGEPLPKRSTRSLKGGRSKRSK